jgi:hypothetical protein
MGRSNRNQTFERAQWHQADCDHSCRASHLESAAGLWHSASFRDYGPAKGGQQTFEQVNISERLFTLSDKEYQQCSVSHIACGSSRAADGKRMSLNVEEIGGSLTVQHYVEDIAEKQHCLIISTSDVFASGNRTTVQVVWKLIAKPLSDITCEFTNVVLVHTTDDYENFIGKKRHNF